MSGNELRFRSTFDTTAVLAGLRQINGAMSGTGASMSSGFNAGSTAISKTESRLGTFTSALGHAKSQIGGVVSSLGVMAGVTGVLGVAAALDKAVTGSIAFNQAMELLKTQAGASQAEVDAMSASLLDLAKTLPQTPEQLAAGLYHVESAGIRGAKALDILRTAALGAATGGADLESVTNALIAANQSGVKGVKDMGAAMGTLNAVVGAGNMRMQDLADAMGTGVLSTAKNYGVTIQSVGAALADMTDQGIPAVDAATRLNSAMRLMAAPTSKAITELKSIGLGQYQLANDMRGPGGMLAAVEDLKKHLDDSGLSATKQAALIAAAFGGKQSGAILTLIGNVELLKQKQDAVNKGAAGFGTAVASAEQTAEFKLKTFESTIDSTAIKVGNVLLPIVTEAISALGDFIGSHQDQIVSAVEDGVIIARNVASAVGTAVGSIARFWGGLPSGLKDVLLQGFVADRTFKFLFGIDPAKAVFNMAVSGVESALGKAIGSGLATAGLGKLFVQPVYVTNPGFGGGLPGIGGAGAGAAEDAAVGAGEVAGGMTVGDVVATLVTGSALAILAPAVAVLALDAMATAGNRGPAGNPAVQTPSGTVDESYSPTGAGYRQGPGYRPQATYQQLTGANSPQAPVPVHDEGWDVKYVKPEQNPAWLQQWFAGKSATGLNLTSQSIIGALIHGNGTKGSLASLTKTVEGGGGTAADWQRLLTLIPIMKDGDPKLAPQLDKLGKWISAHLPDKTRIDGAMAKADNIVRSTEAVPQKLADLKAIQANLLKHGDTNAAHQIAELIALVKKHQQLTINISTAWSSGSGGTGAKLVGKSTTLREFAAGGRPDLHKPALIGENGPEIWVPDVPGTVVPFGIGNARSHGGRALAAGLGGSVTINLNITTPVMTPGVVDQIGRVLEPVISRALQRKGLATARAF